MYLDFLVKIPESRGKLLHEKRGDTTYIKYEYERTYDPKRQYTLPLRATIGKQSKDDATMMQPNQNFLKYFPEAELPLYESRADRSSCLRIGAHTVISKVIRDYKLSEILGLYFKQKELGLFLDLVTYSIITENNAGQYYPMYAYNHPLFTENMKIYSDSTVSDFLQSITADQSVGFLNEWNGSRNHREKIYISYDSTNKNCQAGDIEMAEFGKAKVDMGTPIFNYAIAYDTNNREPLFYEKYPGSINDVSQIRLTLDKVIGYGYKKIGFILDRGYFSKSNIEHMDKSGFSFVIMVKGMASFVNQLIRDHRGSFENKRVCDMDGYGLYGKTVKNKLYETDEKERYFHIYHSVTKEAAERTVFEEKLRKMKAYLLAHVNKEIDFGQIFQHYYYMHYEESTNVFVYPEERINTTEKEIELCGYFVIVTSDKMTAKEAIRLYKSRDTSEKLFSGDKSYLGNKSIRVHSDESASAKIFIEFVALIVRSRMYTNLLDEMKKMNKKSNYMTVPAAIRELEKIEMVRQTDNIYRLDHAVTATQKTILGAFDLNESHIKNRATEISNSLQKNKK